MKLKLKLITNRKWIYFIQHHYVLHSQKRRNHKISKWPFYVCVRISYNALCTNLNYTLLYWNTFANHQSRHSTSHHFHRLFFCKTIHLFFYIYLTQNKFLLSILFKWERIKERICISFIIHMFNKTTTTKNRRKKKKTNKQWKRYLTLTSVQNYCWNYPINARIVTASKKKQKYVIILLKKVSHILPTII